MKQNSKNHKRWGPKTKFGGGKKKDDALEDATRVTPIFFILCPGADPIQAVEHIAQKRGWEDKVFRVAMGQQQDVVAMSRLDEGHKKVFFLLCALPVKLFFWE